MGTSNLPNNQQHLVPAGLDESLQQTDTSSQDEIKSLEPTERKPIQSFPANSSTIPARSDLTRGARSHDALVIRRGARKYVQAAGGGANAARRMPASLAVAGGLIRFASAFANSGHKGALREFSLDSLVDAPFEEVAIELMEILCPPGGLMDEAVAREAMCETIADLVFAGISSFERMSRDDLAEFFVTFVSRSIVCKILIEVGKDAYFTSKDYRGVNWSRKTLNGFVSGCVRDKVLYSEQNFTHSDTSAINDYVHQIYTAALNCIIDSGRN